MKGIGKECERKERKRLKYERNRSKEERGRGV
jgi:hypothetical protein